MIFQMEGSGVPVMNDDQYVLSYRCDWAYPCRLKEAESVKAKHQEARLEISKYGSAAKFMALDEEKNQTRDLIHAKVGSYAVGRESSSY